VTTQAPTATERRTTTRDDGVPADGDPGGDGDGDAASDANLDGGPETESTPESAATEQTAPNARTGNASAGPLFGIGRYGGGQGLPEPTDPVVVVGVGAGAVAAGVATRSTVVAGSAPTTTATLLTTATDALATVRRTVSERLPEVIGLGYAKWAGRDPLDHETRDTLCERVESSPGTYLTELADAVDEPMGTVRHHLKILEREGLIEGAKLRGKRRYYPVGETPDALDAAMSQDGPREVLVTLAEVGDASVSTIADALDRDPSTVSHHLSRLEEDDLVERERDGRSKVNRLAPATEAALAPQVGDTVESDGAAGADATPADD
jgi:DNA-binding transcriptional ArsR family regulator